jgi:hypothetical protein
MAELDGPHENGPRHEGPWSVEDFTQHRQFEPVAVFEDLEGARAIYRRAR